MTTASEEIKGYCAVCAAKCATIAQVQDGRLVAVRADRSHPNTGFCPKAGAAPDVVYSPRRLRTPLRRTRPKTAADPGWVPITWDEAMAEIGQRLNRIKAESGAEAVAFSRPAPGGSPASDWAPYFARLANAFGTPNTVATSHICQWGRDAGLMYTFGTGLPTPHFEAAKTILIWGHNPKASHIQNWRRIRAAQRRGARLIVVDPRRSDSVAQADLWIRNAPGSDTALALAVVHVMLRDELFDADFVLQWTNAPFLLDEQSGQLLRGRDLGIGKPDDFVVLDAATGRPAAIDTALPPASWGARPALYADLALTRADGIGTRARSVMSLLRERVADLTPEKAAARTGVAPAQLEKFAHILAKEGPLAYYTFNGIEQHVDTAQTTRALGILYALTGWLDAEGGNVHFARPAGSQLEGTHLLSKEQNDKRLGLKERPLSAARRAVQAYSLYDSILGDAEYRVRALFSFGGNLLIQNGDSERGRRALETLEFQVHADTFLNPSAETADILLPTTTPWETAHLAIGLGGGPDTVGRVQWRPAVVAPQHEAIGDLDLMFRLADVLGLREHFWQGSLEACLREQAALLGLELDAIRATPGGLDVPLRHRFRKFAGLDEEGRARGFSTPSRKVEIWSQAYRNHGYDPLPAVQPLYDAGADFPLTLTSYKLLEYCHSQGRGIPSLRARVPHAFVEVHPDTAAALSLRQDEPVALRTPAGRITLPVRITDAVEPSVVAAHTGWWEACEELGLAAQDPLSAQGANLNLIISNARRDPISGSVPHKSYPCRLEKLEGLPEHADS